MHQKIQAKIISLFLLLSITIISCNSGSSSYEISITNTSDLTRKLETIEIELSQLPELTVNILVGICITDDSGKEIISQLVDFNTDSLADYIIFQSDLKANETKKFTIVASDCNHVVLENSAQTYCRFVPDRMDDFAWENDKVAFRTYGPACQKLFEDGNPAGLISSGIDCWLKRVDYPIISKWYKKNENGGSYHKDDGEGLDNYHVGTSRGCGGTAIIEDGKYVLSENYSKWNIIANGPIRSAFELEYPSYKVGTKNVSEKKIFTIDLGSNFYQCEVKYECDAQLNEAAVGIIHHKTNGKTTFNKNQAWFTYWETLDESNLGTAIILNPNAALSHNSDTENNWVSLAIMDNSFSYWSGFGWRKAGEFSSSEEWNAYVSKFSEIKNNPLSIKIEKK
ncbi:MAG: DUF4861 domain-containing protein [Deltaproteobacteria bacterium]|nr:DUF4861 domain-containing protein [Deltaproteobacteria bacterium]